MPCVAPYVAIPHLSSVHVELCPACPKIRWWDYISDGLLSTLDGDCLGIF